VERLRFLLKCIEVNTFIATNTTYKTIKRYSTTALKSVLECYGKSRLSSGEKSRSPGGHRSLYIGNHAKILL
jgi:hypothetical protein